MAYLRNYKHFAEEAAISRFEKDFKSIFKGRRKSEIIELFRNLKKRLHYERRVWKWCLNMQPSRGYLMAYLFDFMQGKEAERKLLKKIIHDPYQYTSMAWLEAMIDNYYECGTML